MIRRSLSILFVVACSALPAAAGDFMDTRLSFVLSENNFFAGPGETQINSPGLGIGADHIPLMTTEDGHLPIFVLQQPKLALVSP